MWPFAKSVILGSFAGAGPMLLFTTVLAIGSLPEGLNGDHKLLPSIWLAILPLMVATPVVLASALFIGLPLTAILKHKGWESAGAYTSAGAMTGFLVPIVILMLMDAPAGYVSAVFGAVGGGVAGRTWWVSARARYVEY